MSPPVPDPRAALEAAQLDALRTLLAEVAAGNRFYGPRIRAAGLGGTLADRGTFTARMPLTTKDELVADQRAHPPYGTNLSYPLERYSRFHQTSGTTGEPLRWLDTPESWSRCLEVWQRVFRVAGVGAGDRVFFPFSFGPFLGFWTAFDAAERMGCLVLPGGGLSSAGRLRVLLDNAVTAVCSTPTYAVHLAEVAAAEGVDLAGSAVRVVLVAGEPGGSVPATRDHIARLWGARVLDHHGMTEVGPVSFPNPGHPGVLHVAEESFLAEILDPESFEPSPRGAVGELVLTTLARPGSPLLRYRTGDLVRGSTKDPDALGYPELALEGGILGRADDMVVVRGVNLYPAAVDQVVRSVDGVAEYRVELGTAGAMTDLRLTVEPAPGTAAAALCRKLERELRLAFNLRIPVEAAAPGALPRFELKARRWVRGT